MEKNAVEKENKMGVMPVGKLLVSMSVPIMISMLVQALYNIVDSMFVAKLNENALTAVSLAFPVQNLMIAVGTGTGVGINALVSRSLGRKEYGICQQVLLITALSFALLSALDFCRCLPESSDIHSLLFRLQDPQILSYGTAYVRIIGMMSFGLFMQLVLVRRLLQATGRTFYSMADPASGCDPEYYSGSNHDFWSYSAFQGWRWQVLPLPLLLGRSLLLLQDVIVNHHS